MANTLEMFSESTAVGLAARNITGIEKDIFVAGGYAAWVKAVTGTVPQVTNVNGRAVLVMNPTQIKQFQKWIEGLGKPGRTPPSVSLELGPVFKPIALKYAAILLAAGLAGGYLLGKTF